MKVKTLQSMKNLTFKVETCLWRCPAGCRSRPQIHRTVTLQEGRGEDWLTFSRQWEFSTLPPGRISAPVFPACECMYFQIHVNECISKRSLQTNTHLAIVFLLIREQREYVAGRVERNILGEGSISPKYRVIFLTGPPLNLLSVGR